MDKAKFVSNAHTTQNRMFGFVTTNLRTVRSFAEYIQELVPVYQEFKNTNDLQGWLQYSVDNQQRDKQKYKRLEFAKILFRNVTNNSFLNDNAEKLYDIFQHYGEHYLEIFLSLYLLSGRYFDVENQPLVEIEKVQATYKGDLLHDCLEVLQKNKQNRIFFATLFFNPDFYDVLYYITENECDVSFLEHNEFVKQKIKNAGGTRNFKYDVFVIGNYLIFKNACEKNYAILIQNKEKGLECIVADYVSEIFNTKLNEFVEIDEQHKLKDLFNTYKTLIFDIIVNALKIQDNEDIVTDKKRRKNIKYQSIERYGEICYMDYCNCESDIHKRMYFKNKNGKTYLEGHHIIQMENSKFFKNSLDVIENMIPLCPNCHSKIHNAENKEVVKMLDVIYAKIDKKAFMKQGIFVDENTLRSFYGLEDKR
ncbi:MAG: HNH endonuclease [Bacteroidales bacterium]|nr:HNH endonuclease [Bacteroidales bacterium]